ncbi:MAG TPA: amino acid adenylation domain-containing protein, partial [Pyrinomonadaceae bacterium]|nr:amino acid adenylation domain-containing protein [Pyrinomonadaceae bacterium]
MKNLANSTDLSAEERALFLSLLAEESITPVQEISRRANTDGTPLSFAQQRLWFLDQLIPNSSLYNCPVSAHLQGRLDLNALERSLNEIIRRHDALRTTFGAVAEQPVQTITPTSHLRLPITNLRNLPQAARESEARRLAAEEAGRPFDLSKDSMLRARLLCLSDEDHVLLLTMHHISSDGWSMDVLVKEMVALYQAYSRGWPSPLQELPLQYADYAVWQRESMADEVLQTQLAYWKQRLSDAPPMLDLPLDHPRPSVQSHRGAMRSLKLSPALLISLKELSRQQGVTLFMTLLAAFQALLARYTRQDDISVATPVAGRNRAELEGLIGFFVNTLVLRTDLSGNPPFSELLKRVREVALGAYAHQDLPFERLVEELQPERDMGSNPLFQVMMVFQNAPAETLELPGLNLSLLPNESVTTKFDLTLFLNETSDALHVSLEYSTDLFEPETVGRMLAHFEKLLECVTVDAERRLFDLEFITAREREQLLFEWNETSVSYGQTSVVSLFEDQVKRTPDALAVEFGDQQLTYRELDQRANQLAHYLYKPGVGPDARVGISLERGFELVIAVLGVLKAGAAYVPLDPAYPAERLHLMLNDARCVVLLTTDDLLARLPQTDAKVLKLDRDWQHISIESDAAPQVQIDPENLAYVIYTSGSTGVPKGIAMTHRVLSNMVSWQTRVFPQPARALQFASLNFDVSIQEMMTTWCSGGTLVLVTNEQRHDVNCMTDFLSREQVERIDLPFVYLQHLAEAYEQDRAAPASLRDIISAGEQLECTTQIRQLCERLQCGLYNHYGPSETHAATDHELKGPPDEWPTLAPIGRPIPNTQIYILDHGLQPIPVGVAGELFIGGTNISRGYLHRPELTAERYVPHPFASGSGERLYRTGDLARYLPNATIEFLGRIDHQVKIRGFRIELGEIEAALRRHPRVLHAVVVDKEVRAGDKRLIAYVVPRSDSVASSAELTNYLKMQLPDYMIPAACVTLDHLPLTASGKLHRSALPDPGNGHFDAREIFAAPRTVTEEVLAGIWKQVLGVERVSRNDNFFTLGGHSLLATRTVSRIRDIFHVELQVRSLFDLPTIAELSEHIEELMRSGASLEAPALQPRASNGHLSLSYAQQRLWFLDQLTPHNSAYNLPVGFRVNGPLNLSALQQSISETVKRHESLRTNFINIDGHPVQVIAPARVQHLPILSVERFAAAERELVVQLWTREEGQRPFDLASDSLFRSTVFRLCEQEHVLLVVMHHIISDGWSIEVLMRDVPRTYMTICQGTPSELPELPIQYADYASWQREWLQGEVLENQLSYWRNQLGGLSQLSLPTDHPRPSALSLKGNAIALELPEWLTAKLRALSQAEGSTLFITLLASFQILLARYSGQDDIAVGTPMAGRRWAETEDLVGFFVNTLVMRTRLSGDPTIREVLRRVREVTLEAQTHQDVPFEKLVEELQPQRTLSHGPLFQTMFLFLNEGERLAALDGPTFSSLELNHATEKNDLTLKIVEQENKLAGSLSYSTDLFDESTIRRMTAHWQRILETMIADPEQLLREVELLGTDERRQMLTEWNATECEFPENICLHELFEAQVTRTPDAVAVSFEDQQLSYVELNRRTNQLAHYLRRAGVGPEATVAIYLERSVDMIVALIGVLKAGGAYLPLETTHPKRRVQYKLENATAHVILAQQRTAAMLFEHCAAHRAQVICIDSDWQRIAAEPEDTPVSGVTAENLAYVIYTSGSTGGARGVMVQHHAVVNLAIALREKVYPAGNAPLRVSVNAPLMFDSSVKQLIQLLHGHELCIIPEEVRRDGDELVNYLRLREIEVLDCTPSQLRLLIAGGLFESQSLMLVLAGGEAIDAELWQLLASIKSTTFFNVYGPTECTVDATVHEIELSSSEALIGRPLGNVQTYALDRHGRPVPPGVHAELFIGGGGVARGYLAEPDLTAERFIPDPFSGKAGARLYRSGDRVRYRPNGDISFLGRLDHQVKIRGHRIEPGEIEAALQKDPQVREAVVIERDKRLVAYIVPEQQASLSLPALQKSLREQLPDYMMPAGWVVLEEVPLTPNGKVNRAALPDPGRMRLDTGQSFVVPPTLIEEAMAAIWRQVLDLEHIGRDDNFFWLGGHSLLATQIVSRIRESFQVELPVRSVFESPTLAELSKRVEAMMRSGTSLAAPPLKPLSHDNRIPLSYAQQRLWVLDQLMPGSNAYNMPAEISLDAGLSAGALEQSLSEVMRRHEALRTTFALRGSHPVQQINQPGAWKLPLVDLRGLDVGERAAVTERLRQESALRPFNLEAGPLVRAGLIRVDEEQLLFLLNLHHAVTDGWSMGVLLHEVETLYNAYSRGLPSPLPELEVQYADYAKWQREWLQGEILKEEVTFWRRQLEGAPTLLELETDHPRQFLRTLRGAHHPVVFSAEVSQWLREFHRQEGSTLFMTLMAGFHTLLWRYTGQNEILVGTPIAGRSRIELEPMIGFFVNMI